MQIHVNHAAGNAFAVNVSTPLVAHKDKRRETADRLLTHRGKRMLAFGMIAVSHGKTAAWMMVRTHNMVQAA